jgi:hypothetical protein
VFPLSIYFYTSLSSLTNYGCPSEQTSGRHPTTRQAPGLSSLVHRYPTNATGPVFSFSSITNKHRLPPASNQAAVYLRQRVFFSITNKHRLSQASNQSAVSLRQRAPLVSTSSFFSFSSIAPSCPSEQTSGRHQQQN